MIANFSPSFKNIKNSMPSPPFSCIKNKTKNMHTEAPHLQIPPNTVYVLLPGFLMNNNQYNNTCAHEGFYLKHLIEGKRHFCLVGFHPQLWYRNKFYFAHLAPTPSSCGW
jgi:hypothetical protein